MPSRIAAGIGEPFAALEPEASAFLRRRRVEPFLQLADGHDLLRHNAVEERRQAVGVEQFRPTVAFGALAHLVEEQEVLPDGIRRLREFAEYERMKQEELAGKGGIDAAVVPAASVHDDESVKRHLLGRSDEAVLCVPFG